MELDKKEQYRINLLKGIGHESRTLLNGITGPLQLIQSLGNNPALIEPIKILELSSYRMEKFSIRAMLLADLLANTPTQQSLNVNICDLLRHVVLDLNDQFDLFKIIIDTSALGDIRLVQANRDIAFQCLLIILEQSFQFAKENSTIQISSNATSRTITIVVDDFCILQKFMVDKQNSEELPVEVDIALMFLGFGMLGIEISFDRRDEFTIINIVC